MEYTSLRFCSLEYSLLLLRKWKNNGFIEEAHEILRDTIRKNRVGRDKSLSLGMSDSQSVKISSNDCDLRGINGG